MCLPEYDLPKFGLRSAIRGVRISHASPAVPRVDWGSPFGQSSRDESRRVCGQSFAESGYSSRRSLAVGRWSDADEFRRFGPVYALASREMTSQKIRQYCRTPIPKLLFLIES